MESLLSRGPNQPGPRALLLQGAWNYFLGVTAMGRINLCTGTALALILPMLMAPVLMTNATAQDKKDQRGGAPPAHIAPAAPVQHAAPPAPPPHIAAPVAAAPRVAAPVQQQHIAAPIQQQHIAAPVQQQ